MAETTPTTPSAPAPGAPAQPTQPVAAVPTMLGTVPASPPADAPPVAPEMPAAFEGGAEAWGKLDDAGKTAAITAATAAAEKATAESKARTDAYANAQGKDARLAAYNALSLEEKAAMFKAMPEADRKELGVEDPAIPVYKEFTLPEGMTVDEPGMKAATDLFKEARLPQEQAQKFIDLAVGREKAAAEASVKAYVELQNKWVSEIKADPEIGGDRLDATMASCARAIDRLAVPGLKDALNMTGAGNHPAIVKAFNRLGQLLSEDRFRPGNGAPPAATQTPADKLYPNLPSGNGD